MEILFSSSSLSIPRLNISFFSFCSSPWKELSKCSLLSSPKQILRTSKRGDIPKYNPSDEGQQESEKKKNKRFWSWSGSLSASIRAKRKQHNKEGHMTSIWKKRGQLEVLEGAQCLTQL
ncbi:hypothetical protein GmHk_13G038681 [Glycine max]|nr:hypothetical protein GmHk_13G038681 [Glycine max]